jgi:hypothetical protein
MLPLHHDPGRIVICRGVRLIQVITSSLATSLVPASSPCGTRTNLSALKGRYPWPIDERAGFSEWAGGRSNPRLPGFNRPLDRLSYRPIPFRGPNKNEKARCCRHTGPETPHKGCLWPGVTSARDRAAAGSPPDRRIASLLGNSGWNANTRRTWTTSVYGLSQADLTRDRPHGPPRRLVLL